MLYSLDEICLIPTAVSKIEHRGDVNVFTNKNNYPIFTAPMASIVDETNVNILKDNHLNVIVPRSVAWEKRLEYLQAGDWVAVGLKEAQYIYEYLELQHFTVDKTIRLCIDQANGHMESLLKLCRDLKLRFGTNIKIMTGNIANPYSYREYAKAGVDYVRCSIGSGNVCFPSGTKIKTSKGEKNIEDIAANDIVLTINGEKPVKNTFVKTTNELITINDEIKCTPNHKFLVINKCDKDIVNEKNINEYGFYIEAKNLTDDYLLVQAPNV